MVLPLVLGVTLTRVEFFICAPTTIPTTLITQHSAEPIAVPEKDPTEKQVHITKLS